MSEQNLPTYLTELTSEHVAVTPEAQTMLAQLLDDADDEFTAIRVFVQGGGCGGMTYSMTYSEEISESDGVLECGTSKLILDPVTLNFMQGVTIDYVDEGVNSNFVFKNAFESIGGSGTCGGCGGSGF